MSSGANDEAKVLKFETFRDHGWGHVALHPRWPHVRVAKLFQPLHNDVCPTVKEPNNLQEGLDTRFSVEDFKFSFSAQGIKGGQLIIVPANATEEGMQFDPCISSRTC